MIRKLLRRLFKNERGMVMVEGTIGVIMLLLAATAAMQVLLVGHAAFSTRMAATAAARAYAMTGDRAAAQRAYEFEKGNALKIIKWPASPQLSKVNGRARAVVRGVVVPSLFPGAGWITGGTGPAAAVPIPDEAGEFPLGGAG